MEKRTCPDLPNEETARWLCQGGRMGSERRLQPSPQPIRGTRNDSGSGETGFASCVSASWAPSGPNDRSTLAHVQPKHETLWPLMSWRSPIDPCLLNGDRSNVVR